jgi:hypothetical protein
MEEGDDVPESTRDGGPAPWPAGTACPLCVAHPVSDATFHFELGELGDHAHPAQGRDAGAGGPKTTGLTALVRCRCCPACRRRVVAVARLRWAALPFVAIGMLAWPLSFASSLPSRLWGIDRLETAMLSTLVCAFVIGVPLVLVDHANRSMRRNLESSWLFRRVKERAPLHADVHAHARAHDGAASRDHWKLLADAPRTAVVIDASEILRG